jgi:dipeptidyl-peptidase-4
MKFTKIITLFLLTTFSVVAQQKITIEEIYSGAFRTKEMYELQSHEKHQSIYCFEF